MWRGDAQSPLQNASQWSNMVGGKDFGGGKRVGSWGVGGPSVCACARARAHA